MAAAACVAALAAAALPATARADIVFDRGPDLYAAHDDGSGAHLLVSASRLGMDGLGEPALTPDGTTLLFDGGTTRNEHCSHQCGYGANAVGVYELKDGRVTRLSAAPTPDPPNSVPYTSEDAWPEPTTDGRYVYQYEQCAQYYDSGVQTWGMGCSNQLAETSLSGGSAAATQFASECDDDTVSTSLLGDPSPDPADPDRVAYVGCRTPYNPLRTQKGEIIVAGPNHQDPKVVATGADGSGFQDPSWSPDGSRLIAYNEGGSIDDLDSGFQATVAPGLYAYDPSQGLDPSQSGNPGTLVISAPRDGSNQVVPIASPRYVGAGTIAFAAGGGLWSIPADCAGCTIADATRLYDGGSDASTQSTGLAWTASTVAGATVYPPTPSPAPQPTPTPTPPAPHPTPVPPQPQPLPDTTAPTVSKLRPSPRRVRAGHSARLRFQLSEDATVSVTLQRATGGRRRGHRCVRPTHALRHHARCKRWVRAGRVKARRLAAGAATLTIARRALRRTGHYRALLTAADAAGNRGAARTSLIVLSRRRH